MSNRHWGSQARIQPSCLITVKTLDDFSRAVEVFKANVFNTAVLDLILSVTELVALTFSSSTNFFHILPPFWLQPAPLVMHQAVNIPAKS